jgi:hypothetical protein
MRKSPGYWEDFSNLKRELLTFIETQGTPGVMPTGHQLQKAGRGDLKNAIPKHGGWQLVAERLGLTYSQKRQGYWNDFANLERELLAFIQENGTPSVMPTNEELKKAGRSALANAISKNGGYPVVAERLQLKLAFTSKPQGYWENFVNVKHELFAFIEAYGTPEMMPIQKELLGNGRSDLAYAIPKHGGYQSVAERLGLKFTPTAKPSGYWEDFSNLESELLAFIEKNRTPGVMPTQKQLQKAGYSGLGNAIQKHGGWQPVAKRLRLTYTKRQSGYWKNFNNLKHELLVFIQEYGTPGMMPTSAELKEAGRGDLVNAITKQGGYPAVAERLGLTNTKRRHGYWDDFANVESEILAFIRKCGIPGLMPT